MMIDAFLLFAVLLICGLAMWGANRWEAADNRRIERRMKERQAPMDRQWDAWRKELDEKAAAVELRHCLEIAAEYEPSAARLVEMGKLPANWRDLLTRP